MSIACAIAIPARNESALLGRCLDALGTQTIGSDKFTVVVLANNCDDDTALIAKETASLDAVVIERMFAVGEAHAGSARRAAMAEAAHHAEIILTTDADCVPDANWVEKMLEAFYRGVDAVAGRVSGDWSEMCHWPQAVLDIGALEWKYLALMAEAEAVFDPRPYDPAPRHAQRCGANLGITRAMLERVGGVPAIATGEDRAVLAAVENLGGRVRHEPCSHVTASARTSGRAVGGMADALASRIRDDYRCGPEFEAAEVLVTRLKARAGRRTVAHTSSVQRRMRPCELADEMDRLNALIEQARAR